MAARRLVGLFVAVWAATILPLAASAAAAAPAGAVAATTAATCTPPPRPYPPVVRATVETSATTITIGLKIKVSGVHFCADELITITLGGTFVAFAHTDLNGAFDPPVKVTGSTGYKALCAVGASGLADDRDCTTIKVNTAHGSGAAGGSTGQSAGGSSHGATALTGIEIASLVTLGAVLLASGLVFLRAGRTRPIALQD